jgi:hypothetical protein
MCPLNAQFIAPPFVLAVLKLKVLFINSGNYTWRSERLPPTAAELL